MSERGADGESWRRGLAILSRRVEQIPALLGHALRELPDAVARAVGGTRLASAGLRSVVATGVGSSAAHARILASVLGELGIGARFAALTSFAGEPMDRARPDVLVVFSQGVSPNARLALARAAGFESTFLVTAAPRRSADGPVAAGGDPPEGPRGLAERRRAIDQARARGVRVIEVAGGEEYGTLLRVGGPMTGYAAALALADELARAALAAGGFERGWRVPPADQICARVAQAQRADDPRTAAVPLRALEGKVALLTSGAHLDRIQNLSSKIQEGLLCAPPPAYDLLDFAHGPFQQLHGTDATLLAVTRRDAPGEEQILARLERMLDARRQRLLRLPSTLPGPYAIFEHEAMLNALVLREIAERRIDQVDWPGRGEDAPLYEIGRDAECSTAAAPTATASGVHRSASPAESLSRERGGTGDSGAADRPPGRALESLTWPEVEAQLAAGARVAILPLGSTEQHGPHLPLATDTWIARELARRLCARLPEAIALPTVALGCASEHLGFPGTLSLREETLGAILRDVAVSLERHGFERLFLVSAHGGNQIALDRALAACRAAAPGLSIDCAPSPARLGEIFGQVSAAHGVAPSASGAHAGELETSIVAQLAPEAVRLHRLAAGRMVEGDAGALFYPDLRANAPDGTVGDPRGCDPARADAYLDAWVDCLVESYRTGASRT